MMTQRHLRRFGVGLLRLMLVLGVAALLAANGAGLAGPAGIGQAEARAGLAAQQSAQESQTSAPIQQLIVKYRSGVQLQGSGAPDSVSRMQALSAAAGLQLSYVRSMSGDANVVRLPKKVSAAEAGLLADRIAAMADVEYAEPDYMLHPTLTPNDSSYSSQWHFFETYGINLPGAWDITTGAASIYIAVLDTGITDHPDLDGRWVGGYDFISDDDDTANDGDGRDSDPHDPGDWTAVDECDAGTDAQDSSWHGTHVAGTIGAAGNNGAGVTGINWLSLMVPVRVLGTCGGFTSDIADGMRWAAGLAVSGVPANPHPAKVLNLSLGGPGPCGSPFQNAINAVTAAGAVVVVAAGNTNEDAIGSSPANCSGVITVAATDRAGNKASYSNFGSVVEISAPGGRTGTNSPSPAPQNGVLSTLNAGLTGPAAATYDYAAGTSMAAPHVAGVASLMFSRNPALTPAQVLNILQVTATVFPGGSSCSTSNCGAGIVNAAAAVAAVITPVGLDHQIYLPLVQRAQPPPAGIAGRVTEYGAAAVAVSLELRFYNGSSYSSAGSTITDGSGDYFFPGVPGLGPGQSYYVRYSNPEDNEQRLTGWATGDITAYDGVSLVTLSDFDVGDIQLIAPSGSYVDLPRLFTWQPRPAVPTDSYEFNLFDYGTGDPWFYTDPPLGYVGQYTLNSLPPGFETGHVYVWGLWAYAPDGGFGLSYWVGSVAFNNTGALLGAPVSVQGGEMRPSGLAALMARREGSEARPMP